MRTGCVHSATRLAELADYPLALIGTLIGAMSAAKSGRNLNLFVIVVGVIRLMLGGGIL